jgi:glycosyltransferase involved in cell wall biosynthesis
MLKISRNAPAISIIVATRNREPVLAQFLEAVGRLPRVPDWELVIVDNGSIDGTNTLLNCASKKLPIVMIYEPQPGKSRALNAALAVAKGEILLFADDDIIPAPSWLSALHEASMANPNINVFGGKIVVKQDIIPRWIAASHNLHAILLSEQNLGERPFLFCYDKYPIGPNLAVRRRNLEEKLASWPVELGPGTKLPVGDERAFLMQISLPNDQDRLYVPASEVMHSISGRQLSLTKCATRSFLGGFAAGTITRSYRCAGGGTHGFGQLVLQRITRCSSFLELGCIALRAIGVLAGRMSPYPRLVDNQTGLRYSQSDVSPRMG